MKLYIQNCIGNKRVTKKEQILCKKEAQTLANSSSLPINKGFRAGTPHIPTYANEEREREY